MGGVRTHSDDSHSEISDTTGLLLTFASEYLIIPPRPPPPTPTPPLSTLPPQIFPTILGREGFQFHLFNPSAYLSQHQGGCSQCRVTSDRMTPHVPYKALLLPLPNTQEPKDDHTQPFLPLQTQVRRAILTLRGNQKLGLTCGAFHCLLP